MNRDKLKKIGIATIIIIITVFIANVFISCWRIQKYTCLKMYEDLTVTEKVAAFIDNVHFYTKEEAIKSGIIYSDTKQEAHDIGDMFTPITSYIGTNDGDNTQIKLDKCKEVLNNLHTENSSGRVTNNDLISLMNDCIATVENYQYCLKAYQDIDVEQYKSYRDKMIESYRNATNDLERLNNQ